MRIEKNLTHSYLYLHGMEWKEKSHEQKIIQQCLIPGTLPFRLIQEETETIFQYNFYPYEKIVDYFAEKPMNLKHIIALFESIHSTLLQMEEYLLSPEILGLKKEEIFFDAENNRFLFPLIPSASGNPDEEIKDLIDFIFDNIDEKDEQAILSAYLLHQKKKTETLQIKSILQLLYSQKDKAGNTKEKRFNNLEKNFFGNAIEEISLNNSFENKSFENKSFENKSFENKSFENKSLKNPLPFQELDLSDYKYADYMKNIDGNATASTPDNSEFMSLSQPVEGECNIETEKGKEKEEEKKNKLLFGLKNLFKNKEKEDKLRSIDNIRYESKEQKQVKKKNSTKKELGKVLLGLILMIAFPILLYLWKGSSILHDYLPFFILIETAIFLYASLDFLALFISSKGTRITKPS